MLKHIRHTINLIKNHFRDLPVNKKRSSEWPKVEKEFLEKHPTCAACGGSEHLNVHHIKPFHEFEQLELDPKNLITLCMGVNECHLRLGHAGDFHTYNANIKRDAAKVLKEPSKFASMVENVKLRAKS